MATQAAGFNSASASWEDHRAAFFKALEQSDRQTLETVLKKYPEAVDWYDAKGTPPLHAAFDKRDIDTFRFLLEKGANPDQKAHLSGLRALFASYDDPSVIEKAIKAGEKSYIIALLQHNGRKNYRSPAYTAPKAVRFEIGDLLNRGEQIRAEFYAEKEAAKSAPPVAAPATTAGPNNDIDIMKPAQVQRRTPNAAA